MLNGRSLRLLFGVSLLIVIWGMTFYMDLRSEVFSLELIDNIPADSSGPEARRELTPVGFSCRENEPTDQEVKAMVDEVIMQVLGPKGLESIISPGDKVVIKVNNVGPYLGKKGEKGRGVITDPRIVRYVAEKVREIIGFEKTSDLKVVDTVFYSDVNPSLKNDKKSFYWARLERTGDNQVDPEDVCYDGDGDGILDGTSQARLVNLDALTKSQRMVTKVKVSSGSKDLVVCLPKFLHTKQQAEGSDEYCDVLIGLPVFKSHGLTGITGALKLHYGFRFATSMEGDTGRYTHSGLYWGLGGIHKRENLLNYLCAEHQVRTYDFIIMDCLTGNRRGPLNPGSGTFSTVDHQPVDYILTNALLASKDPVAIDTVESAFAGYDPTSIHLLETAYQNGLGTNRVEAIDLIGKESFAKHRRYLSKLYQSKKGYPFQDKWGGARVAPIIDAQYAVSIVDSKPTKNGFCSISYVIQPQNEDHPKIARVELWMNGRRVACQTKGIKEHGEFEVALSEGYAEPVHYRIVIWDQMFNCADSGEKAFVYRE